ncbi:MAG: hypothetical protein GOVbin1709_51 [Prokaryotic dsDNA virus sp.]|nr:MAG: hypothetical protein GOVbin1709_51 [Prokaryotic dsDNA virus sp.]|tara:strand:+ start:4753 stop:5232 length:480 start_codon:yes stop_codon:yes gene_type:complete
MASKKDTVKNYDIVKAKFNQTKNIVELCDKFRNYKETINNACEAIINMDKNSSINKISINVEIKLPDNNKDEYSSNADGLLKSLADVDNPSDFVDKLKQIDKYINKKDKYKDEKIKLSNFNINLKDLTDNSLISILMRIRDIIDNELEDCSDKFNKVFK